jgi:hypothetical protein
VAYPLQFILFLPFIRLGEFIFNELPMHFSIPQIYNMFKKDLLGAIDTLWWTTMHAIIAWLLVCPIPALAIYLVLNKTFKETVRRWELKRKANENNLRP